jgi:hypothetical protein
MVAACVYREDVQKLASCRVQGHRDIQPMNPFQRREVTIMTKARRDEPEDDSFFSGRHLTGFMAVIAVCAVVATAEVFFGVAEPLPGDLAWAQVAPDAAGQGFQDAPAVASK